MNPYALPNLLSPTQQPDYRASKTNAKGSHIDISLSRAVFRVVDIVERLLFRAGH